MQFLSTPSPLKNQIKILFGTGPKCFLIILLCYHKISLGSFNHCIWVIYYSFSEDTLYGPVHSEMAINIYKQALEDIKKQGGTIACGGKVREHQLLLNVN